MAGEIDNTTPTPNPLAEAQPKSLDELFSRDPEGYTGQDLATIVAEFRRMSAKWATEEAQGATKSKTGAKKAKDVLSKQVDSLDDLGL